jgi:predicted Rossmann fold nucleotide-binding protein DprA/Smf involved in DNA uptake
MTTNMLSADAQATALLVGRFGKGSAKPLARAEFNRVARALHLLGLRPSDLFRQVPDDLPIDRERISSLMSRGTALALAFESWGQLGIRVVSRADPSYPARFRTRLKSGSAPILYYAGDLSLMERPTVSVVGSRDATEAGLRFAHGIGERAAAEGVVTVSGDARGVDRAAMEAASSSGGYVIGIVADSLSKTALSKRYRQAISSGRLLLLSHVEPDARFTVALAMERNRYLYAAGDVVIVADSDVKGGTWSGAIENLKHRWAPAFVRIGHDVREGNTALLREGLIEIRDTWINDKSSINSLFDATMDSPNSPSLFSIEKSKPGEKGEYYFDRDVIFRCFTENLIDFLRSPLTTSNIAEHFGLEIHQAEVWLQRAAVTGIIEVNADQQWKLSSSAE